MAARGATSGRKEQDMMQVRRWGAVAVLIATLSLGGAAEAADTGRVAVLDQQVIVQRTVAGKRALEALQEFSRSRQRILGADNEEMQALEKELREAPASLSEAVKREKQERFRAKYEGYQRRLQDFQKEIQTKQKDLDDEYQKKIRDIASELAQKHGYVAVLDKGNDSTLKIVIYHQPAIDLTDQIIKEFDRRYK
jgi:outer membrane protein